jgi:myosin heavy subunit
MAEEVIGIKIITDAAQATQDVQNLDKAFSDTDTSVKSLRTQLREAQAQVGLMADKFGATSKEAIEAAKRAADLKDRIGDAKALTDAFNPDAKFKAVASSLAGVAGGFAALQGGMALFGKENKNVEAALLKVNAAMALSQGLQSVGESVDSFKQLGAVIKSTTVFQEANNAATKTAAAVQKAFGVSVDTTSKGFNVLKGAIVATGIGALVVALGLVINNFDAISKWIKNSPLGDLAKGVSNLVTQFTDFIGVTSEAERNLNKLSAANQRANEDINNRIKVLKAQGGSEKEIYDLSQQRVNNELATLRESLKTKGELTAEESKQFRDLKTEQLVLTADYNKKVADDNAKRSEEAKKKRDENNKQLIEDKKTADKMLLDLQNEKALAEITSEEDKAKKQAEINMNARIAEIDALKVDTKTKNELKKATEEAYQLEVKAIDDQIKADRAEKDKKFEEDLQTTLSEARIAKFKEGKEKEVAALDEALVADTKKVLDNADYTEEQKGLMVAALREKYGAEVAEIDDKYEKEANDKEKARLDSIVNNENLSYAARKKGVDEALALNKKLFAEGKIDSVAYTKTEKELADARVEIGKKEAAARAENAQKISATLKNAAKAIGEHTVAGKAAAIAAVTIDTYMSATSAFKSLAGIPIVGPVLGAVAAAAAIVAGLKNVKAIMAVKAPDVPAGSSDPGFVNIPSPGAPATGGSMPSLGGGGTPDLGGGGGSTGGGGGGSTIRAYVVERDISDSQNRQAEIENRARFE